MRALAGPVKTRWNWSLNRVALAPLDASTHERLLNQRPCPETRSPISFLQLASRVMEQVVDMDKQLLLFLKQVRACMRVFLIHVGAQCEPVES